MSSLTLDSKDAHDIWGGSGHLSRKLGRPDYLDKMFEEKFEAFTFSPAKAAVYRLGNFGTSREKLKTWELAP